MNPREGLSGMASSQVNPEGYTFLSHLEVSLPWLLHSEALNLGESGFSFFFFCSAVSRDFITQNISRAVKGGFDALESEDRSEE